MTLAHEAQFYSTVDEFLEGTLRFAHKALSLGEPLLVAVPQPRLDLLRERVAGATFVDMAEDGRNPNRILPWLWRSFVEQHQPARGELPPIAGHSRFGVNGW